MIKDKLKHLDDIHLCPIGVKDAYTAVAIGVEDMDSLFDSGWMKYILEEYGLCAEDFSIWDNYGTEWLIIEKSKTQSTHFNCKNFLFLEHCKLNEDIDFVGAKYRITNIARKVSEYGTTESEVLVNAQRVLKSGKLGKSRTRIFYHYNPDHSMVIEQDYRN